jgi:hypothetical protein
VNGFPALVTNISALPLSCGYSGSAGSPLAVFIKLPRRDWRLVFDSGIGVQGHEWKKRRGKDLLYLGLHGSYCGGLGVDECWSLMEFDGSASWKWIGIKIMTAQMGRGADLDQRKYVKARSTPFRPASLTPLTRLRAP